MDATERECQTELFGLVLGDGSGDSGELVGSRLSLERVLLLVRGVEGKDC